MRRSNGLINSPGVRAGVLLVVCALVAFAGVGCRGDRTTKRPRQFFPDMDNQPKYKAQSRSTFFREFVDTEAEGNRRGERFGRSMREPVLGTVAFGYRSSPVSFAGVDFAERERFLKADREVFGGLSMVLDADGQPVLDASGRARTVYLERMPIERILGVERTDPAFASEFAQFMALGEKKYNIFCIVCHGGTGDGKGTVGTRWSYPLPSFHTEVYLYGGEKGQDGYIFHTIRNGVPNPAENAPYPLMMPAYGNRMSEKESWAIVAYLRALQKSADAPLESVPERERLELERQRGASVSSAGAAPKERGS